MSLPLLLLVAVVTIGCHGQSFYCNGCHRGGRDCCKKCFEYEGSRPLSYNLFDSMLIWEEYSLAKDPSAKDISTGTIGRILSIEWQYDKQPEGHGVIITSLSTPQGTLKRFLFFLRFPPSMHRTSKKRWPKKGPREKGEKRKPCHIPIQKTVGLNGDRWVSCDSPTLNSTSQYINSVDIHTGNTYLWPKRKIRFCSKYI